MTRTAPADTPLIPPDIETDPYSVPVLLNPYPFFDAMRTAGAVVRLSRYGVYATARYEEAKIVLNDHERFTARAGIGIQDIRKPGLFRIPNRMLENDPPDHTAIRTTLTRILSPVVIRRWREHFEAGARRLVAELVARGRFDGVHDLAETYILDVFPEAVGVELPRVPALAIGEMSFNQAGPDNDLCKAAMKAAEPYLDWYNRSVRREAMRPGSIGEMLFDAEARGEFEDGIASNISRAFVRGGMDTTIAGIGFALNQLARNPAQWALLRENSKLAKNAFEEAIRHESPSYVNYRTTTREVELGGYRLPADAKIGVFTGAANRDARYWAEPETYDLRRDTTGLHVAFGHGTHTCIGQMIARLEAECILSELARNARTIRLDGEVRYRAINQLHTLDALPLAITT